MAKDTKDTATKELPAVTKTLFVLQNLSSGEYFSEGTEDVEDVSTADAWDNVEEAKAVRNSVNDAARDCKYIVQIVEAK